MARWTEFGILAPLPHLRKRPPQEERVEQAKLGGLEDNLDRLEKTLENNRQAGNLH
jgi:hypothetical protein